MKNGITLLVASVLLVLCVVQKEARYGTAQYKSVEKMYNYPSPDTKIAISESRYEGELLSDVQRFEFADSLKSEPTARIANQRLLNIAAGSKMLNY
ncbi:hypothetical protein GCM10007423_61660 [Dyadobacter endophyticus]|uniref:Uncharacterized protein n=2 Tax=Spirosomataceae TaxID=2896860 RepID=A0ABQ1Z9N7_9BACT|nr:hypothetical protein GCM10007423_61660 [Dyadobacter endophyticus]